MTHTRNLLALLLLAGLVLRFAWVGFINSDDLFYANGARGWLAHFPYVGDSHWSLRHTFVLPLALSFKLFGETEFALTLVPVLYFLALLVLSYGIVAREVSAGAGFAVALALLTTPVFAIWSTIATPDTAEVVFVVLSLWLFYRATIYHDASNQGAGNRGTALYIAAGFCAGLAWLTRETALALVLVYGVLFLSGYRAPRSRYFLIALGFLIPTLAEILYFWVQTGDAWYRLRVDLDQGRSHGATTRVATGNIEVSPWLNPWLATFVSHNFGLVFFLALPALLWARRARAQISPWLVLMAALLVLWFLALGYIIPVRKLARYFEVAAYAAVVLSVSWLALALWPKRRAWALILFGSLISSNLLAIYVDNREPLFGEHALVDWLARTHTPIYTDPDTRDAAKFLLDAQQLSSLVSVSPPPPGSLFFYNPNRVNSTTAADYRAQFSPKASWAAQDKIAPAPKQLGLILAKVGAAQHLPQTLMRKLTSPNDAAVIYRVTGP